MLLLLLLLLTGLISSTHQQCLTPSDQVRRLSDSAAQSLLQSELRFSADLLHTVSSIQPDQNIFFSPSSVYKALLLAYFISANTTESNLKKALHLASDVDKRDVYEAYTSQKQQERSRASSYRLGRVNHLYASRDLAVRSCVSSLLRDELFVVSFRSPTFATRTINAWTLMKTGYAFEEDFLPEGRLKDNARLVLVNAAYFKGKWKHQFKAGNTFQRDFRLSDGTSVNTTMMTQENNFKFTVVERLSAEVVELPYEGEDVSMFVLKPRQPSASAVKRLLTQLDYEAIQSVVRAVTEVTTVNLRITIPTFTVEKSLDLREVLESMKVGNVFEAANLTTLADNRGLSISEAVHKAKVRVSEVGTEAAPPTGHNGLPTSAHSSFVADLPFVYFIYDKKTSLVLFMGVFNRPE